MSYSLEYRLNAGVDIYPDFEPNASVGGTYADKPTISYAPLVGNDFADSIMKPIAPAFVVQLLQSGARVETIFRLLCEEINGISNRRARGGNIRAADEDFDRVVRLLQKNQNNGYIDLQVRSKEEDVLLMITQSEDSRANADITELKRLLGLPPDQDSYRMIYGLLPGESGEIALLTRSMYSILLDIAADVNIPGEDIENGRATPGYEGLKAIIAIRSGKREPEDAFIAIPYRDRWFWIDDTDIASKQVFSSVLTLSMMAGSGLERVAPVLTIPTR